MAITSICDAFQNPTWILFQQIHWWNVFACKLGIFWKQAENLTTTILIRGFQQELSTTYLATPKWGSMQPNLGFYHPKSEKLATQIYIPWSHEVDVTDPFNKLFKGGWRIYIPWSMESWLVAWLGGGRTSELEVEPSWIPKHHHLPGRKCLSASVDSSPDGTTTDWQSGNAGEKRDKNGLFSNNFTGRFSRWI